MDRDKGKSLKMDCGQSWEDFKGLLWSLLHWFTILWNTFKGLPSLPYGEGQLKYTQDDYHRHFPRQLTQDKRQAENDRPRANQRKPLTTEDKMIYFLIPWGISLMIITYIWVRSDAD